MKNIRLPYQASKFPKLGGVREYRYVSTRVYLLRRFIGRIVDTHDADMTSLRFLRLIIPRSSFQTITGLP